MRLLSGDYTRNLTADGLSQVVKATRKGRGVQVGYV